jgi:hypothetical protein
MSAALKTTGELPKVLWNLLPLLLSAERAAERAGISGRRIRALIKDEKISAFKISDAHDAEWIVYWPSVVEYYRKRGIEFIPASSP